MQDDEPRQYGLAAHAPPSGGASDLRERIVDTSLMLAEEKGSWSAVRLHDVADRLSVPTPEILDHYRDLDAVADAWFLRGLKAMVGPKPGDFLENPEWRRTEICLCAWFDALSVHRRVTAQMLRGKLHLSHPHHWVPMVFNLSRTIQWLREAAQLPAVYGTRRAWFGEQAAHVSHSEWLTSSISSLSITTVRFTRFTAPRLTTRAGVCPL